MSTTPVTRRSFSIWSLIRFEATDLGTDPAYADVVEECERRLRAVVDPEAATAQAFADQEARIEALGGLDAMLARGNFPYTPAPGEAPKLAQIPGGLTKRSGPVREF